MAVLIAAAAGLPLQASAQERLCDTSYENCRTPLLDLINAETVGIDVAFWFMKDSRYSNALINRFKAGVPVRVIIDPRANATYPENGPILDALKNAGIPMRKKADGGILHWKMMLFAGQNKVEFSGANFSSAAFVPADPYVNYVDEVIYFSDDQVIVDSFKRKFDDLWVSDASSSPPYANYANITGTPVRAYPLYSISPDLNFPPNQNFAKRAVSEYDKETQQIDVSMYRITDRRHSDAMIAAMQRGVRIRLLTEPEQYRGIEAEKYYWHSWNVDRMYKAGIDHAATGLPGSIEIRHRKHLGLMHQKSIVLYSRGMTIFGSSNWTSASASSQAEHNYFTTKPSFFTYFIDQFNRKWNNTNPVGALETEPFVPKPPDTPVYVSPAQGATGVSTSSVSLVWNGGFWAHKYDIYFGTTSNPPLLAADQELGPSTSSTNNKTYTLPPLQAGTTYYWRIVSKTMADQIKAGAVWSFTTAGTGGTTTGTPFGGTPVALPGTIQAENFDEGGAGVAYADTTAGNSGGQYRSTDVDVGSATDSGSGYYVGWTRGGEWLAYTVNVGTSGNYVARIRVASKGSGGTFRIEVDGVNKTGRLTVPDTGGWQNWTTITSPAFSLSAGTQVVRLHLEAEGASGAVGNFNWIAVDQSSSSSTTSPYGGTPVALPGTIELENFDIGPAGAAYADTTLGNTGGVYRSTDVDIGVASDTGGGYNIGWTRGGEWLVYTATVSTSGTYVAQVRLASNGAGGTYRLEVDGTAITGTLSVPNTGGWQNWTTITTPSFTLAAGTRVIKLSLLSTGSSGAVGNFNWVAIVPQSSGTASTSPYGGTAVSLPGTVQTENFDEGGAGLAYSDTTSGNTGGKYRATDVDIESAADAGTGFNVGWTRGGEWLQYTVNVASAGTYEAQVRLASKGSGGIFRITVNGQDVTGPMAVPDTGGWQNWMTIVSPSFSLASGQQALRLVMDSVGTTGAVGNFNWIAVVAPGTTTTASSTPYGGTPHPLLGTIEAEHFDEGGFQLAYYDTTSGNRGGEFRATDVDLGVASDTGGGYYVGWTRGGEWLKYTAEVADAGTYVAQVRVASNGDGGVFRLELDGQDITGPIAIPDTGGWQNWTTLVTQPFDVQSGVQDLRLRLDSVGSTGAVGNFNWMAFGPASS